MAEKYLIIEELQKRWRLDHVNSARRVVHRYKKKLKPIKVGTRILIPLDAVESFERGMRVFAPDDES